ncbi:hypothetical protein L6452_19158 [Arctium lappa]|uniref:Uncharacterized protein n=1 Tax=Arctium lappa TaxID=4217 RepID=A0ACB9B7E0_ARCLA|nr:hypothetical protein L6452_19158 [Arctium lappa]
MLSLLRRWWRKKAMMVGCRKKTMERPCTGGVKLIKKGGKVGGFTRVWVRCRRWRRSRGKRRGMGGWRMVASGTGFSSVHRKKKGKRKGREGAG